MSLELLLHMDGTSYVDSSGNNRVVTVNGAVQSATEVKFGDKSSFHTRSFESELRITDQVTNFGTNDFTVDFWVYPQFTGSYAIWATSGIGGTIVDCLFIGTQDGKLRWYHPDSGIVLGNDLTLNAWQHIAIVRSSGTVHIFQDGIKSITHADTRSYIQANDLYIGNAGWGDFLYNTEGYIDEFRILKDEATWTENFTPPTSAYGESQSSGGAPLLCWQLTGKHHNGRIFSLEGPDKFPGIDKLDLPNISDINVIEDGKKII